MSRPGFVTFLEKNSPPMMFNAGDAFHYETLPEGTRVIYPPGPHEPLADPNVAIERALSPGPRAFASIKPQAPRDSAPPSVPPVSWRKR